MGTKAINSELKRELDKADSAAFSDGRAEHARSIIKESHFSIDEAQRRGRGAGMNPAGRFEALCSHSVDDGWQQDELAPLRTTVQIEKAHRIITHNQSPDIGFDRSINPYRGCEHGCIYCFARPSHAYMGLSAGLDFETRLFAKPDAAKCLERELAKPGYKPQPIAIGSNTDPYQPIEKNWRIMRQVLEVLLNAGHPVTITTKSALILRDCDILSEMAKRNLVQVALSVTTLERVLARKMEPRCSTPSKRLEAVEKLVKANVPASVLVAPLIPGLNDHEMEKILKEAANAGATGAGYILLRLPFEVAPLFKEWLLREYPDRYRRVMMLIREMRGGKDYDADWKSRMRGSGPFAELIARRFKLARERLGFSQRFPSLSLSHFVAPIIGPQQLSLF